MRQETDLISIESNFRYTGTTYDDLNDLMTNILEYEAVFNSMDWTKEELKNISKQLVETGRIFAEEQGFSPNNNFTESGMLNHLTVPELYALRPGKTGRLYYGIKSDLTTNGVRFYNDARNDRGQPYAGHMEYGFHDRGGNLVPARPFMRPAFYAVAEASKGNFRGIMKGLLDNIWLTQGYRGISQLTFGHKKGSGSIFWKNPSAFAGKMAGRGRISEIRGASFRKRMTTSRNLGERKTGFNIRKNQRDVHRMRVPHDIRSRKKWGGLESGRSAKSERLRNQKYQQSKIDAANKKQAQRNRQRLQATGQWDNRLDKPKSDIKKRSSSVNTNKKNTSSKEKEWKEYMKQHKMLEHEIESTKYNPDKYGYAKDYVDFENINYGESAYDMHISSGDDSFYDNGQWNY